MKIIFRKFLIGALAFLPFFVIYLLLVWLKGFGIDLFLYFSDLVGSHLGAIVLLLLSFYGIYLIGSSIEKAGKSFVINLLEQAIQKIPAINFLYSAIKKILDIFSQKNNDSKGVVLVEYPNDGLWVPAYVLNKQDDVLVLFVPTSPNPTSGYVVIVQESKILHTDLSVAEASQFIVSMGSDFVRAEHISSLITKADKQRAKTNKTTKVTQKISQSAKPIRLSKAKQIAQKTIKSTTTSKEKK